MKIDLHMHSTASDGKLSPEELVDLATKKRLPAIAITDHEILDGSKKAVKYAEDKNIEVVSGIEFGARDEKLGLYDIHIIGLFLDLENKEVGELSRKLIEARVVQKKEIILKLNELGYDISFEELQREVEGENYGRPHIAEILMRKYNKLKSIRQVFDELLGGKGRAYVVQWKETMRRTIEIIHNAGGVAVLAHPMLYENYGVDPRRVVEKFARCGGDGVEVDYFYENRGVGGKDLVEKARGFSEEFGLVVSGGGDFHRFGDCEIGDYGVSESEFERLKECWREKWKKN